MNEAKIIAAICSGDADQYAGLVERYHIGLIIHCERLVKDRDDAEDIAQRAFIKAYEKIAVFDPSHARFSTWLYKIATNMALDFLRANKRQLPTETEDIETLSPVYLTAEKDEQVREVRAAVAVLMPPEQRQAIQLYYWEGKSYQTIAKEMDVPINTVKSWLHRAKLQLREQLS
jgi:RNA polymerase sigma-70 factor (ECF subfamily)